jgi:hypothetical protein
MLFLMMEFENLEGRTLAYTLINKAAVTVSLFLKYSVSA